MSGLACRGFDCVTFETTVLTAVLTSEIAEFIASRAACRPVEAAPLSEPRLPGTATNEFRTLCRAVGRGQHRRPPRDLDVDRNRTSDLEPADRNGAADRTLDRELPIAAVSTALWLVEKSPEMMSSAGELQAAGHWGTHVPRYAVLPATARLGGPQTKTGATVERHGALGLPVSEPRLNVGGTVRVDQGCRGRLGLSRAGRNAPPTTLEPIPRRESQFAVEVGDSPVPGRVESAAEERSDRDRRWSPPGCRTGRHRCLRVPPVSPLK